MADSLNQRHTSHIVDQYNIKGVDDKTTIELLNKEQELQEHTWKTCLQ